MVMGSSVGVTVGVLGGSVELVVTVLLGGPGGTTVVVGSGIDVGGSVVGSVDAVSVLFDVGPGVVTTVSVGTEGLVVRSKVIVGSGVVDGSVGGIVVVLLAVVVGMIRGSSKVLVTPSVEVGTSDGDGVTLGASVVTGVVVATSLMVVAGAVTLASRAVEASDKILLIKVPMPPRGSSVELVTKPVGAIRKLLSAVVGVTTVVASEVAVLVLVLVAVVGAMMVSGNSPVFAVVVVARAISLRASGNVAASDGAADPEAAVSSVLVTASEASAAAEVKADEAETTTEVTSLVASVPVTEAADVLAKLVEPVVNRSLRVLKKSFKVVDCLAVVPRRVDDKGSEEDGTVSGAGIGAGRRVGDKVCPGVVVLTNCRLICFGK